MDGSVFVFRRSEVSDLEQHRGPWRIAVPEMKQFFWQFEKDAFMTSMTFEGKHPVPSPFPGGTRGALAAGAALTGLQDRQREETEEKGLQVRTRSTEQPA